MFQKGLNTSVDHGLRLARKPALLARRNQLGKVAGLSACHANRSLAKPSIQLPKNNQTGKKLLTPSRLFGTRQEQ
jgi:hypothetical protein